MQFQRLTIFTGILVFCITTVLQAQWIDSLTVLVQSESTSDSVKALALNELAEAYHQQSPTVSDSIAKEAIQYAQMLHTSSIAAESYYNMGVAQAILGNYSEALHRGFQALELFEAARNQEDVAKTLQFIGVTYLEQELLDKALEYLFQANQLLQKFDLPLLLAANNHEIGRCYYAKEDPDRALVYYREALNIRQQYEDLEGIAASLTNMGSIFYDVFQYEKAMHYHRRALSIRQANNDMVGIATNYRHLAYLYRKQGDFDSAIVALQLGQFFADSLQNRKERLALYQEKVNLLEELGQIDDAFEVQKRYIALKDTLFNLEKTEEVLRLQAEFQTLQRQQENDILKQQNEQSSIKLQRQSLAFIGILGVLFFVMIIGFIYWKNAKRTRKINRVLSTQKQEIESQHKIIDQQNQEILRKSEDIKSSLRYAKRIQSATLPKLEDMRRVLSEFFVFYRPRDIVSGDFYWFAELKPKPIYRKNASAQEIRSVFQGLSSSKAVLAAVDCTGHGVPGAFMSMLGEQMLEKIVMEAHVTDPGLILDMLHRDVRKTLRQEETNNRDGMDLSLCVLDHKQGKVAFAGAKNPFYYIEDGEMKVIKGDRRSIGGRGDLRYTTHEIKIKQPTTFYLFSDGFKDQFGGQEGRKFGPVQFRKLLCEIHHLPMDEQNQILNDTFMQWIAQGNERQIDDVLIIGFRVNPPNA